MKALPAEETDVSSLAGREGKAKFASHDWPRLVAPRMASETETNGSTRAASREDGEADESLNMVSCV